MTWIWFILIFFVLVVVHEFGHLLMAKMAGIAVVEFSIGMGPDLWSFTKGGTKYAIKLLPVGGACLFENEDLEAGLLDKEGGRPPAAAEGKPFAQASVWQRISCVLAGPLFNFGLAFVLALLLVGWTYKIDPVILGVKQGGPAWEAGVQAGDRVLSVNGERVYLYEEVAMASFFSQGSSVKLGVERAGRRLELSLAPVLDPESGRYLFGLEFGQEAQVDGLAGRVRYAWYEMRFGVKSVYKSLALLLQGRLDRRAVAGPVGIAVNVVGKTYEEAKPYGWEAVVLSMMHITMLLSVNLAVMNLLPLPALDGGRLMFLLWEALRGRPISPKKEGLAHMAGFLLLMALMVLVFFNDLVNVFG